MGCIYTYNNKKYTKEELLVVLAVHEVEAVNKLTNIGLENSSKVVDENGEPLVVWRADTIRFNEFDPKKIGTTLKTAWRNAGFFFSPNYEGANQYKAFYGSNVLRPFFINARIPYTMSGDEFYGTMDWGSMPNQKYKTLAKATAQANERIKEIKKDHDLTLIKIGDQVVELIAFKPNQIKLADGSNTTFNPNTNDIRFSELTPQEQKQLVNNHIYHLTEIGNQIKEAYLKETDPVKKEDYKKQYQRNQEILNTLSKGKEDVRFSKDIEEGDYRMSHRAPNENDTPLYDLTNAYGDDIYTGKAYYYFGDGDATMDKESVRILQSIRNKPDAKVKIYRAVPKGIKKINSGDWVSINKKYAIEHGERILDGDYEIIEDTVTAKQLFTDGNSVHEQGVKYSKANKYRGALITTAQGQRILAAMESPLATTAAHEAIFHATIEPFLEANREDRETFIQAYNDKFGKEYGKESEWTTNVSEYAARLYETYLASGREISEIEVPNKDLRERIQAAFKAFTEFMEGIILQYKGKDVTLTPATKAYFDRITLGSTGNAGGAGQGPLAGATSTVKQQTPDVSSVKGTTAKRIAATMTPEAIKELAESIGDSKVKAEKITLEQYDKIGEEAFEFYLNYLEEGGTIEEVKNHLVTRPVSEVRGWLVGAAKLASYYRSNNDPRQYVLIEAINLTGSLAGDLLYRFRTDVIGRYIPIVPAKMVSDHFEKLNQELEDGRKIEDIKQEAIKDLNVEAESVAEEVNQKLTNINSPSDIPTKKEFNTLMGRLSGRIKDFSNKIAKFKKEGNVKLSAEGVEPDAEEKDFYQEVQNFVREVFVESVHDYTRTKRILTKVLKDQGFDNEQIAKAWNNSFDTVLQAEFSDAIYEEIKNATDTHITQYAPDNMYKKNGELTKAGVAWQAKMVKMGLPVNTKKIRIPKDNKSKGVKDPLIIFKNILSQKKQDANTATKNQTVEERLKAGKYSITEVQKAIDQAASLIKDPAERAEAIAALEDKISILLRKSIGTHLSRQIIRDNQDIIKELLKNRESAQELNTTISTDLIKKYGLDPETAKYFEQVIKEVIKNRVESLSEAQSNKAYLNHLGLNKKALEEAIKEKEARLLEIRAYKGGDKDKKAELNKEQTKLVKQLKNLKDKLENLDFKVQDALKDKRSLSNFLNIAASGELNKSAVAQQFAERFSLTHLTPEDVQELENLSNILHSAQNTLERQEAYLALGNLIKEKVKSKVDFDFFIAFGYANYLSGPNATLSAALGNIAVGSATLLAEFVEEIATDFAKYLKGDKKNAVKNLKLFYDMLTFSMRRVSVLVVPKVKGILKGIEIDPSLDPRLSLKESGLIDKVQAYLDNKFRLQQDLKKYFSKENDKTVAEFIKIIAKTGFLSIAAIQAYAAKGVVIMDILKDPIQTFFIQRAEFREKVKELGEEEALATFEALHDKFHELGKSKDFLTSFEKHLQSTSDKVEQEGVKIANYMSLTGNTYGYLGMVADKIDQISNKLNAVRADDDAAWYKKALSGFLTFTLLHTLPFAKMTIARIPSVGKAFSPFAFIGPLKEEDKIDTSSMTKVLSAGALAFTTAAVGTIAAGAGFVAIPLGVAAALGVATKIDKNFRNYYYNPNYYALVKPGGELEFIDYSDRYKRNKHIAAALGTAMTLLTLSLFRPVKCTDEEDKNCFEPIFDDFMITGSGPGVYPRKDGLEQHGLFFKNEDGKTWRKIVGWKDIVFMNGLMAPLATMFDTYYFKEGADANSLNATLLLDVITSPFTDSNELSFISDIVESPLSKLVNYFSQPKKEGESQKTSQKALENFTKEVAAALAKGIPGSMGLYKFLTDLHDVYMGDGYKDAKVTVTIPTPYVKKGEIGIMPEGKHALNSFFTEMANQMVLVKELLGEDGKEGILYNTTGLPEPIKINHPLKRTFAFMYNPKEEDMYKQPNYTETQNRYARLLATHRNLDTPFAAKIDGILQNNISPSMEPNYVTVADGFIPFNESIKAANEINRRVGEYMMAHLDELETADKRNFELVLTNIYEIKAAEVRGELYMTYLNPILKEWDSKRTDSGPRVYQENDKGEVINTLTSDADLPEEKVNIAHNSSRSVLKGTKNGIKNIWTKKEDPIYPEDEDKKIWIIDTGKLTDFFLQNQIQYDPAKGGALRTNKYKERPVEDVKKLGTPEDEFKVVLTEKQREELLKKTDLEKKKAAKLNDN